MRNKIALLAWFLVFFTPQAYSTEVKFPEFEGLPLDVKVRILSYGDKPGNTFILSKPIHNKMRETLMWAKPDNELGRFVDDAVDDTLQVKGDSDIYHALDGRTRDILMRRLLYYSAGLKDEPSKAKVRALLTRHVADNIFFWRDSLIEVSRSYPTVALTAIDLARGERAYGTPLVHSAHMPKIIQQKIHEAEVVIALAREEGVYRIWRLSSLPELNCLTTVCRPHTEEYVVYNLTEMDGRIPDKDVRIVYHDGEMRDWPLN